VNAVVVRSSWPLFAISFAVAIALVGMVVAGVWHAQIGHSPPLVALIVVSFVASLVGAAGGLVLANTRRNVMWILAVALSMTAFLALLATVLSLLGPT
jgi:hypothetical protein